MLPSPHHVTKNKQRDMPRLARCLDFFLVYCEIMLPFLPILPPGTRAAETLKRRASRGVWPFNPTWHSVCVLGVHVQHGNKKTS